MSTVKDQPELYSPLLLDFLALLLFPKTIQPVQLVPQLPDPRIEALQVIVDTYPTMDVSPRMRTAKTGVGDQEKAPKNPTICR